MHKLLFAIPIVIATGHAASAWADEPARWPQIQKSQALRLRGAAKLPQEKPAERRDRLEREREVLLRTSIPFAEWQIRKCIDDAARALAEGLGRMDTLGAAFRQQAKDFNRMAESWRKDIRRYRNRIAAIDAELRRLP